MRWSNLGWERQRAWMRDFRLDWGSLSLQAGAVETLRPTGAPEVLRASGGVVFRRADEAVRGESMFLDAAEGLFRVDSAETVIAPFRLSALRLERDPSGTRFSQVALDQALPGRPELALGAREAFLDGRSGRMTLRTARISVYGARLATVPKMTFSVGFGAQGSGNRIEMPLSFRQSRTSGLATGLRLPVPLGASTTGKLVWETTTTRGEQWAFDAERTLYRSVSNRAGFFADAPGHSGATPLERLVAPPPRRFPVPAAEDILTMPELIALPGDPTWVRVTASGHRRREFARRGAVVLVSRLPEIRFDAHAPLGTGFADVRLSTGTFREEATDRRVVSTARSQWQARIAAPPVPLIKPVRLQLQGSGSLNRYDGARRYSVGEARIALDAPLGARSIVAAGVILRKEIGITPFLFDRVEAGTEGQFRGQIAFGTIVAAMAVRFDLRQHRIFDREVGVGWSGRILEPRLTYRTLGSQIGFTVAVPSLSL